MAGAGAKLFTSGSVLTADQVNTFLMDQSIMRFTSTTTRDAAFGGAGEPTLAEGMFAYTTDTNTLWLYNGSSWVNLLGSDIGEQALSNRNVIINGAMQVAQRGTSVAGITTGAGLAYNTADRWGFYPTTMGTWTNTVETDAPTGSGLRNSFKVLCTTADASPAAGDNLQVGYRLEGQNIQQFCKGTASAKQFALSFWVKSNVTTGTYVITLSDIDNNRLVSGTYTITASATWEKKTLIFAADTTGAFDNNNELSLLIRFGLGAGSNTSSGTLRTAWTAAVAADEFVGQTNVAAAINNYWQITGVQLEVGSVATPFEFEDIGVTLAKCQRYYQRTTGARNFATTVAQTSTDAYGLVPLPVSMRVPPTSVDTNTLRAFDLVNAATSISAVTLDGSVSSETYAAVKIVTTGMTAFRTYFVIENGAGSYLGFGAEL